MSIARFVFTGMLLALLTLTQVLQTQHAGAVTYTGNRGPGGLFATDSASALLHWLDATNGNFSFSGPSVTSWSDSSFSANTMNTHGSAVAGAVTRNSSVGAVNGQATISFLGGVGTNRMVPNADIVLNTSAGGTGASTFAIFAMDDTLDNDTLWTRTSANQQFFRTAGNDLYFHNTTTYPLGAQNINEFRIRHMEMREDGLPTSAFDSRFYSNGTVTNSFGSAPTDFALNDLGGGTGCCGPMDGQVAESIMYNRPLFVAERRIVENYLSARYNLGSTVAGVNNTLGGNDLYDGDLDTNGNFDFNVFGVGNDGANFVDSSGQAGFGIEVTAGPGAGNLNSGDWILAGHSATPNALVPLNTSPSMDGEQWQRSWFVDVTDTGNNGLNATLAFNFDDAGLTGLFESDKAYLLLYSATQGGPWDILLDDFSLLGETVLFNAIGLETGYYTLGIVTIPIPEPGSGMLLFTSVALAGLRRRRRA